MRNEILEEVWRNRDAFAKRHNYDLDAMVKELRELERHALGPLVNREKASRGKHSPWKRPFLG